MKIKIAHESLYEFSSPIFLEPHVLRFKPKCAPYNNLVNFDLSITPKPIGITQQEDTESNTIHFCWFEGMYNKLEIYAESILNVREYNPFHFIIYPPEFNTIPFSYSGLQLKTLQQALVAGPLSDVIKDYTQKILEQSDHKTLTFLTNLTSQIHEDFVVESRMKGAPYTPEKVFKLKKGSCRDLVWMQIQMLRSLGIASRFVSGYYFVSVQEPEFELHAWVEAYLPGAGWLGLDPSSGMVVSNHYIPVVTGSHYETTLPVTGSIRGSASSNLISNVMIEVLNIA